jgi:hypothetical protein
LWVCRSNYVWMVHSHDLWRSQSGLRRSNKDATSFCCCCRFDTDRNVNAHLSMHTYFAQMLFGETAKSYMN